jgi:hypothetical protein
MKKIALLAFCSLILVAGFATALINGGSQVFFSSSHNSGGGTITAPGGSVVTVTVSASGAPGGTYSQECNIFGALFSNGSGTLQTTNSNASATFVMPSSGSISWTGVFTEDHTFGSGSISVN